MSVYLEPFLFAPSSLTPTALTRLAAQLAETPALWREHLRWPGTERWHARLRHTPLYDVWLLSWTAGQATELHDHGGSAGAFHVLSGSLRETTAVGTPGSVRLTERTVTAGQGVTFGPAHVHDVAHAGTGPAASIHVYSPPLTSMGYYDTTGGELRRSRTLATTRPEPTWRELALH